MKKSRMLSTAGVAALSAALALGVSSDPAGADPDGKSNRGRGKDNSCVFAWDHCSEGVAITGNNNLRGTTVFSFKDVGPVTFGQFIGVWNEGGDLPDVIDGSTPDDAILASIAPPGFPLYGENAPNIPGQNLRLQEIPTVVGPAGQLSGVDAPPLPSVDDAGVLQPGFGPKKTDYTLGQWLEAEGELKMRCKGELPDDYTEVKMELEGLVPNGGVYTMWAFWDDGEEAPTPLTVIPFGGSGTNTFTTDKDGEAELEFTIPFCVLDEFEGGVELVAVQLDYHSDDGATGTVPNLPLVPYRGPGIIGHSALIFPVRATPCEDLGNCVSRP